MKIKFRVTLIALLVSAQLLAGYPTQAQAPTWQQSATGLSVNQNQEKKTAGLAFTVQAQSWPFLTLQGGVTDANNNALAGPVGIELGVISIPGSGTAALSAENVDWAHNEMTFTTGSASQLNVWISRLSPAILVQPSSNTLRLLSGNVTGNTFDGTTVTNRPLGPAYPKYVAYMSGGNVQVRNLSMTAMPLSLEQSWLLLWYGGNSHFVETKKPSTYTDSFSPSLPQTEAYQADAPLLLVFEKQPVSIQHSNEGGVDLSFTDSAGYVALLPLYGREHLASAATENWSQGLPSQVREKAQWWANHLCSFPVTASETYSYDGATDTAIIGENVSFLNVCSGGFTFAPLPPILGIAKDLPSVTFSGSVQDGNLPTEFGPTLGIENTQQYTWRVSGLSKYSDSKRIMINTGQAPSELEQELVSQTNKIISAGHFAPWIFADGIPRGDIKGDISWLNPADVIYHLVEIASVLPDNVRANFVDYIKTERSTYPPEDVYNLPLEQGTIRQNFSVTGPETFDRWRDLRPELFMKRATLYSFFGLSRYYELTQEPLSSQVWQKAKAALDQDMREQDWATFYWFNGYQDRPEAVVNANRHLAGLIGFIKLAKMAGDKESESLGRVLLAKAAVLRLGMAHYPRYLYSANLVELPAQPDWQPRYSAGLWSGPLFNYSWTGPMDDARQVRTMDQFGVYLDDHSANISNWEETTSAHLVAYKDMVPELARLLTDFAKQDAEIHAKKVEALFPHWYAAFAEGMLGAEHNLGHPIDSFQVFMAKAWIQQESAAKLAVYVDIPWLEAGDLFYVHKLAETIKAYRGVNWDDTVEPMLTPAKAASSPVARQGEVVTYTLTIRDAGGPLTLTIPITVTDLLPTGLTYSSGLCASSWGAAPLCSSQRITWTGAIPVDTAVVVSYTAQVTTSHSAALTNQMDVDAGPYGVYTRSVTILANPLAVYLPLILKAMGQ